MLKKLSPILLLIFGLVFIANAQTAPAEGPKAEIVFEQTLHNFGDIHQGDVVTYVFKFKNTGKAPLVLSNVLVTCGCTAPEWPKEPILPGKKGEIKVSFNSAGKMGAQNKVITVQSNAPQTTVTIVANVLPAVAPATPATPGK
jgi:uncharacterized repeat protein (TIGR01451 family)